MSLSALLGYSRSKAFRTATDSAASWSGKSGEVWHVDLEPARGSEANKQRPAVIVSNDRANSTAMRLGHGVVTVVPITSNTAKIYPFQVFLSAATNGLAVDSKAQAEQIRSVAARRLLRRLGRVSPDELTAIDDALRLHLGL